MRCGCDVRGGGRGGGFGVSNGGATALSLVAMGPASKRAIRGSLRRSRLLCRRAGPCAVGRVKGVMELGFRAISVAWSRVP